MPRQKNTGLNRFLKDYGLLTAAGIVFTYWWMSTGKPQAESLLKVLSSHVEDLNRLKKPEGEFISRGAASLVAFWDNILKQDPDQLTLNHIKYFAQDMPIFMKRYTNFVGFCEKIKEANSRGENRAGVSIQYPANNTTRIDEELRVMLDGCDLMVRLRDLFHIAISKLEGPTNATKLFEDFDEIPQP